MVQALLPTDAGADADLLRAAGFRRISDLLYLVCLDGEFPTVQPSSGLEFHFLASNAEPSFAALVEATYEGTLDCPAVNGLRSIHERLARLSGDGNIRSTTVAFRSATGRERRLPDRVRLSAVSNARTDLHGPVAGGAEAGSRPGHRPPRIMAGRGRPAATARAGGRRGERAGAADVCRGRFPGMGPQVGFHTRRCSRGSGTSWRRRIAAGRNCGFLPDFRLNCVSGMGRLNRFSTAGPVLWSGKIDGALFARIVFSGVSSAAE